MSLKGLVKFAVPGFLAVFVTVSISGQLFEICVILCLALFLCRALFTSDVGVYSLAALSFTMLLSIFCIKKSLISPEDIEQDQIKKSKKHKKELIVNQDKKKRNKDKKKRKVKPMEDNKENLHMLIEGTKIYQTLKEFSDLQMTKMQLYDFLSHYLLNREQLARNKYPVPGTTSGETFSKEGVVRRKCNRCGKTFHVSLKGVLETSESCSYHPQRPKKHDKGYLHECCGKSTDVSGCKVCPGHVCGEPILHNVIFKNVREKRQVRSGNSRGVYALDCEMVYTNLGLQLAKIGMVNLEGLTIYETYVLPDNEIIDYNTMYSGITPKDLKGVTTTLADVQTFLDRLLSSDSILVGHGLENDLKVLRIMHDRIIDTAVLFPRSNGTKCKLKELAQQYLNQTIQDSPNGHDCIEDARTCMSLMLHQVKKDQPRSRVFAQQQNQYGRNCLIQDQNNRVSDSPFIEPCY